MLACLEPFVPGMSYQQPPYNLMSALAGKNCHFLSYQQTPYDLLSAALTGKNSHFWSYQQPRYNLLSFLTGKNCHFMSSQLLTFNLMSDLAGIISIL